MEFMAYIKFSLYLKNLIILKMIKKNLIKVTQAQYERKDSQVQNPDLDVDKDATKVKQERYVCYMKTQNLNVQLKIIEFDNNMIRIISSKQKSVHLEIPAN